MFILTKISDLVRIPPDEFHKDTALAVLHQLNKQYAGKVVPRVGMCVSVFDLLSADEGQLQPGDGAAFVNVSFRVLVFKPFVGEICTGWIKRCSAEGIAVSLLGMFDDVFIPQRMLFEGCRFSPEDGAWVWPMDGGDLYLDVNEAVRFRVEQELFVDVKPGRPDEREEAAKLAEPAEANGTGPEGTSTGTGTEPAPSTNSPTPYAILGSCQTDGMGLVSWWE